MTAISFWRSMAASNSLNGRVTCSCCSPLSALNSAMPQEATFQGGDRFLGLDNLGLDLGSDLPLQSFDLRLHLPHAVALEAFRIGQAGDYLSGFVAFDVGEVGLLALNELAGVIEMPFCGPLMNLRTGSMTLLHIEQRVPGG